MMSFPVIPIIIILCLLLIYLLSQLNQVFKGNVRSSSEVIGLRGEIKVRKVLVKAFRKIPHRIFDDILISYNGDFTQIDHLIVSSRGIFVVETKNLEGWIFGNQKIRTWTQSIYGNNYKFSNPLHQNFKHIKILSKAMGMQASAFESVIVFAGKSEFKTALPNNVVDLFGLKTYIKLFSKSRINTHQIEQIVNNLSDIILENNEENLNKHRKHVKDIAYRKNTRYRYN